MGRSREGWGVGSAWFDAGGSGVVGCGVQAGLIGWSCQDSFHRQGRARFSEQGRMFGSQRVYCCGGVLLEERRGGDLGREKRCRDRVERVYVSVVVKRGGGAPLEVVTMGKPF